MEYNGRYFEAAKAEWADVDFGDRRLNKRASRIGESFLANPFATPPKMLKKDKDLKAFYRFMDSDKVSHEKLILPHVIKSRERLSQEKVVLAVQDSTTLVFDCEMEVKGAYDVGNIQGNLVPNIRPDRILTRIHRGSNVLEGAFHVPYPSVLRFSSMQASKQIIAIAIA